VWGDPVTTRQLSAEVAKALSAEQVVLWIAGARDRERF
jgi:hypothetical protein